MAQLTLVSCGRHKSDLLALGVREEVVWIDRASEHDVIVQIDEALRKTRNLSALAEQSKMHQAKRTKGGGGGGEEQGRRNAASGNKQKHGMHVEQGDGEGEEGDGEREIRGTDSVKVHFDSGAREGGQVREVCENLAVCDDGDARVG